MKKLTTLMAAGLAVLAYHTANAQVGLHVSFNFGNVPVRTVYQPAPDPYNGYDNGDDYYYLPDVEAYYSVPQHCYYYNDGQRWVNAAYLPGRYHDYDWRTARHYEIRGDRPFMHHDMYRARYGGFGQMGGGYAGNRFDNRGGFDQGRGGFDRPMDNGRRGFGGQDRGGFDNRDRRYPDNQYPNGGQYQNRGGFDQRGGFDGSRNDNRGGQYPAGNNGMDRGGWNQQPANNGNQNGQPQGGYNGGGRNQGGNDGQNRGGSMNQQPGNNGGQNRGGNMDQPANNGGQNGQGRRNGGFNGNGDNHFAANQIGVVRPPRF